MGGNPRCQVLKDSCVLRWRLDLPVTQTHLAIQEQLDGKTVDWKEKVSDEECQK